MSDLRQKLIEVANALEIDSAWWLEQAERDDINPDEGERYLGRYEGMKWAAAAIFDALPEDAQ